MLRFLVRNTTRRTLRLWFFMNAILAAITFSMLLVRKQRHDHIDSAKYESLLRAEGALSVARRHVPKERDTSQQNDTFHVPSEIVFVKRPTVDPSPNVCDVFNEDGMPSSLQEEFVFNPGRLITLKNHCYAKERVNTTKRGKTVVFVLSHRRSGTHATISLIRENFPEVTVIKTNHLLLDRSIHNGCNELQEMRAVGHLLYVVRDPMEVMVSMQAYVTFIRKKDASSLGNIYQEKILRWDEFLRERGSFSSNLTFTYNLTRLQYWKCHVLSWSLQPDVVFLSFQNITKNPEFAVDTLARLFGLNRKTDRVSAPKRGSHTVLFRGGISREDEIDAAGREAGYSILREHTWLNQTLSHCQPLLPSKLPSMEGFLKDATPRYKFTVIR